MNLKILIAGDVAVRVLCPDAPLPRFAGAGLLADLDIDGDDADAGETLNILWHAADSEEMFSRPVLRTALAQVFDALKHQPILSAADIRALLSWEELNRRYSSDAGGQSLEEAASLAGESWPLKRPPVPRERRTAAE
jgi:hypothetical protein